MKADLLKNIAEVGYNVGFGAKKHFATYDIVEKIPGWISFISMAFGIYALILENLSNNFLSASFAVLGIVGLYITLYDAKKTDYEKTGIELTKLYNELGKLYRHVKNLSDSDLERIEIELQRIQSEYYSISMSKQILFSDWYAHYKFFWQHQIDWVDEQKNFSFFRDKIPLSVYLVLIAGTVFVCCLNVPQYICQWIL